jgi:hypothetical protein
MSDFDPENRFQQVFSFLQNIWKKLEKIEKLVEKVAREIPEPVPHYKPGVPDHLKSMFRSPADASNETSKAFEELEATIKDWKPASIPGWAIEHKKIRIGTNHLGTYVVECPPRFTDRQRTGVAIALYNALLQYEEKLKSEF